MHPLNTPEPQPESSKKRAQNVQHLKKAARTFEDISHYFLSAAEADVSPDAAGTAGHLTESSLSTASDSEPASRRSASQPMRRKENCASCAHLIARAGQPFQCRIFSLDYAAYKVERRERIDLNEGRTCPFFLRVTSKQIEEILRSHGSPLSSDQVREYGHHVDEQLSLTKTITFSQRGETSAEEQLREELFRYLLDGYTIVEATITQEEKRSEGKHSRTTTHTVRLRIQPER